MDLSGKIYQNNVGLKFKVLSQNRKIKTETYYNIKFLKTNSIKIAERRNILHGRVTDNFDKHIYNVACKGNICTSKPLINKIAFKRWYAMIERCYNLNAINYKSYGAKGVFVSERWLCFENYFNDIFNLQGFDEIKYLKGEIQLDKDLKILGNKEYSLEKCIFVDKNINLNNQPTKMKKMIAISPDKKKYEFNNINQFAKQFNLTARSIGKVLHKQLNHHKNWKFYYK